MQKDMNIKERRDSCSRSESCEKPSLSGSGKAVGDRNKPQKDSLNETFCIRPGFEMAIANHSPSRGLGMCVEIDRAPVDFCYNLSHRIRCTVSHGKRSREVIERLPGDSVLAYLPKTTNTVDAPAGQKIVGVSLRISVQVFRELFSRVPCCLKRLGLERAGAVGEQRFYQQTPFNQESFFILKQIFECPYHGDIRKLFLEAKALELISLKLAEIETNRKPNLSDLSCRDLDRVREAYHILVERLDQPPSLNDLSGLVGINRNKLNQGFKHVYGKTVFNVLRDARLSKAWTLLHRTELSLSEIALTVGYNNQANFTAAFRKRFGQTPKIVRRKCIGMPYCDKAMAC